MKNILLVSHIYPNNEPKSYQYMKNQCAGNNIPFLDYSNDGKYYQTLFFSR